MRVLLLVIDGFGIGELNDASLYGDEGANTYCSVKDADLPCLRNLGLDNIFGTGYDPVDKPLGAFGRVRELSAGKDTLAGHREIAGRIQYYRSPVLSDGVNSHTKAKLERAFGRKIIGNYAASGTEIINVLGDEHIKTGSVIAYTSQDSVLQIAAHESVIPPEELYELCLRARAIMTGDNAVDRIIARPFIGNSGNYVRTQNRRDFALPPVGDNLLLRLQANGVKTIGVGKIKDIFAGVGLDESRESHGNREVYNSITDIMDTVSDNCLIFANFVDTDMLFGHRRDARGYKNCMEELDNFIGGIMMKMQEDDVLIVTSDHGNDPAFTTTTDHTREYVPIMFYGGNIQGNVDLHTIDGMDRTAHTVLELFNVMNTSRSLLNLMTTRQNRASILRHFKKTLKNKKSDNQYQ